MDIVSYSVAAKQKQRIEQVIANPDSTSGIVTTPSVIAIGETINIPAGRTAVLPNTTVNGTLVVDGEVFIPSGSSYTTTNINVSGVGSRITGDFSNATIASRTALQTNVLNSPTRVMALPNGTSDISQYACVNNQDPTNASFGTMQCTNSLVAFSSSISGSGTYLPMAFFNGGLERLRIDTSGNVGIGTSSPFSSGGKSLHMYNSLNDGTPASNTSLYLESMSRNANVFLKGLSCSLQFVDTTGVTNGALVFNHTDKTLTMNSPVALGYGAGSGGNVTQLTSKSTAVTLNKPSGRIVTNASSLATDQIITFRFFNSFITTNDSIVLTEIFPAGGVANKYSIKAVTDADGSTLIYIKNTYGSTLSEAIYIKFEIIKGAIS